MDKPPQQTICPQTYLIYQASYMYIMCTYMWHFQNRKFCLLLNIKLLALFIVKRFKKSTTYDNVWIIVIIILVPVLVFM